MACSTGPGQGVCGEEEQKDYYQAGCMTQQGEGNQVVYQCKEPSFHY